MCFTELDVTNFMRCDITKIVNKIVLLSVIAEFTENGKRTIRIFSRIARGATVLTNFSESGRLSLDGKWTSMARHTQLAIMVKRTIYSNGVAFPTTGIGSHDSTEFTGQWIRSRKQL